MDELSSSKGCLAETSKRKDKEKRTPLICFHSPRAAPAARGPPRAARLCARTCVRVGAPGRAAVNAEGRALAHCPSKRSPTAERGRSGLGGSGRGSPVGHWDPSSRPRRPHRRSALPAGDADASGDLGPGTRARLAERGCGSGFAGGREEPERWEHRTRRRGEGC